MFATTGLKPATCYAITTGTVAAQSTNPITVGIRTVRLASTQAAWVTIGNGPTATATTSVYIPANVPEYFQCSGSGNEKVSALQVSASGSVNITEMTS
jgi:hypothetical protein